MNCRMQSGSSSVRCCPGPHVVGSGWMTGWFPTGSCGSSVPGRLGGMYPSGTVRGPRCTPVSVGRRRTAPSSGCCGPRRRRRTRPESWSGWCRSTRPSCAPTSTPPGPEKGAWRPRTRTLPRWPDKQDPSRLRCRRPPVDLHRHRRKHQRLHPVHRRDGSDTGTPLWAGTRPGETRPCAGRRGLQLQGDSDLAAVPEYRPHHPREGRPSPQPAPAWPSWRTPASLRQAALQATQRRRKVLVRHEAPCCIPGTAGRNWTAIPGPDGSPRSER